MVAVTIYAVNTVPTNFSLDGKCRISFSENMENQPPLNREQLVSIQAIYNEWALLISYVKIKVIITWLRPNNIIFTATRIWLYPNYRMLSI